MTKTKFGKVTEIFDSKIIDVKSWICFIELLSSLFLSNKTVNEIEKKALFIGKWGTVTSFKFVSVQSCGNTKYKKLLKSYSSFIITWH